jgi:pimeloyl-ACP methyl ester carboxylesterase
VNDTTIHYVKGGSGSPILLWHGFLETWYCCRKIMPSLAKKYTVIATDMRGYGDSEKPDSGYDAHTLADDFRGLIQKEGISEELIIIAHDMGAPPALLYAAEHPNEIKALVYMDNPVLTTKNMRLLNSFDPSIQKRGGLWWWGFAFATDMPERLLIGNERKFLTWFYEFSPDGGASVEEAAIQEYLRSFCGTEGIRGSFGIYRDVFKSMEQTDIYEENKVKTPILALGGGLGDMVKKMLQGVAEDVYGDVVPNCGHFIPDERPQYVIDELEKFLISVEKE